MYLPGSSERVPSLTHDPNPCNEVLLLYCQIAALTPVYKQTKQTWRKQRHALLLNNSLRKQETCFNSFLRLWHSKPTPHQEGTKHWPSGEGQEKGPVFIFPL